MQELIGSLMYGRNSLKITQVKSGGAIILGVPFQISGAVRTEIIDNIYDLTLKYIKLYLQHHTRKNNER